MDNDADTVTPLDGDGHNVTGVEDQFSTGNVKPEDYETRGQTTVATRRGYRFAPQDKDLPVITSDGIKVTAEQAKALVEESDGLVSVRKNEEGE